MAVVLKARTRPGKRDALYRLWESRLRPRAADNAAQLAYAFCADVNDPDVFWIFELYSNPEAMGANAQAPWFAEYMRASVALLAGPPEVMTGKPMWTKGVAGD